MDDLESTVLDGRYQVLRQIGGSDERPLVVASDLQRGTVVCLRLWPFGSAMVSPAALPGLLPFASGADSGALLPHEFGVDGGIAYTIRPYQTATSLAARLGANSVIEPAEAVRLLRGAAQTILIAHEHGFGHGHLRAEHILMGPNGGLHVCGFDQPDNHYSPAREQQDVRALLALLHGLLAASFDRTRAGSGQVLGVGMSNALRDLLVETDRWLGGSSPSLALFVEALQRAERRLMGVHPMRVGVTATGRTVTALGRRLRRLGPLLQPYLLALGLLSGTLLFLAGAFDGSPAEARRLLIYAVAPTAMPAIGTMSIPSPAVPTMSPPTAFVPADRMPVTATATPAPRMATEARDANRSSVVPTTAPRWIAPTSTPVAREQRFESALAASSTTPRRIETGARPTATMRSSDTRISAEPTRDPAAPTASPAPTATARPSATATPGPSSAASTPVPRPAAPAVSAPTPRPTATRTAPPVSAATRATSPLGTATSGRRP